MKRMPYVDAHGTTVAASPARTWSALQSVLRSELAGNPPALLAKAMALEPPAARGGWSGSLGDTLPGFEVREVTEASHLALVGRHRFSQYALVFDVEEAEGGKASRLRAETYAAFPGLLGRCYRLAVIGSGGHRLVVRRLLGRVAARA